MTPAEKVDVDVEDAPFLAVEMEARGRGAQQQLTFRTNVDDVVACGPEQSAAFCRAAARPRPQAVCVGARPLGGAADARAACTTSSPSPSRNRAMVSASPASGAAAPSFRSVPPRRSVHLELGSDEAHLGGREQFVVGDRHLEQLALELRRPEVEEALEFGKARVKVVVLPDVGLQQRRVVRQAVEDLGRRQAVSSQQGGESRALASKSPMSVPVPPDSTLE